MHSLLETRISTFPRSTKRSTFLQHFSGVEDVFCVTQFFSFHSIRILKSLDPVPPCFHC